MAQAELAVDSVVKASMSAATTVSASAPSPASASSTSAATAAAARAKSRNRYNKSMKLTRKMHLYAGLFMTPWVFLYGATAMLFNHPLAFSDQETRVIAASDLAGTPLAELPKAEVLAAQVVDAINATAQEAGDKQGTKYRLTRPEQAAFSREYSTTVPGDSKDYLVRIDLNAGAGSVRSMAKREETTRAPAAPFVRRTPLKLDPSPMDAISKSMPTVLTRLGLPAQPTTETPGPRGGREGMESQSPGREEGKAEAGPARRGRGGRGGEGGPGERRGGNSVEGSNGPDAESLANAGAPAMRGLAGPQAQGLGGRGFGGPELGFYMMEGADKVWKVGYNLQTGLLTGRAEDAPPNIDPLSTRRFLLRLHTAHGYPAQLNARWFWAIAVDLMFVSMVGWGFTGLLMWWQMKNVRFVGGIVLAVGIASSLIVAFAMHSMMISGEGR